MQQTRSSVPPLARGAAVLGAGTGLLACAPSPSSALAALRLPGPAAGAVTADPSALLVAVLAVLAWGLTAWLVLATLVTLSSRLPGLAGRAGHLLTRCLVPRALRRVLELALGLTVATSAVWVCPASAADSGAEAAPPPRPAAAAVTAASPSLDWPVAGQPSAAPPDSGAGRPRRPRRRRPRRHPLVAGRALAR